MLKLSVRHVILFVVGAIVTASLLFFQWRGTQVSQGEFGEADLASLSPEIKPEDQEYLAAENVAQCSRERLYFQNDLERMPLVLKARHISERQNEMPRQCFEFMLRSWGNSGIKERKPVFAYCKKADGFPERGNFKPCVSEEYINAIYNSYSDILGCLGIPGRERLPKLLTESGGHINTLGGGMDAGIAQFVDVSIESANPEFADIQAKFARARGPACDRMRSIVANLKPVPTFAKKGFFRRKKDIGTGNRCLLTTTPQNPALSVFYMAIKHFQDRRAIQNYVEMPDFRIMDRFRRAGLMESEIDKDKFLQMMQTLAYNAGANGATTLLKNYLDMKISHGRVVSRGDFNFMRPNTAVDQDFMDTIAKGLKSKQELVIARQQLKSKYRDADLTFSQYLFLYQDVGGAGYLSWVAKRAKRFNQIFTEGTCIPESYLSLE